MGKFNINKAIELLQEIGKINVNNLGMVEIEELKKELKQNGYKTTFRVVDNDYLTLIPKKLSFLSEKNWE